MKTQNQNGGAQGTDAPYLPKAAKGVCWLGWVCLAIGIIAGCSDKGDSDSQNGQSGESVLEWSPPPALPDYSTWESTSNSLAHGLVSADPYLAGIDTASNAVYFGKPPEGYEIITNDAGHFCVRHDGYVDAPSTNWVSTNKWVEIILSWRIYGILHPFYPDWKKL